MKFHPNLMIKTPSLKSIRNKEINNKNLDAKEGVALLKALEDLETKDIDYKHLQYKSGDSIYITLNEVKLNLEDFENEIKELETKKSIERTIHNE